MSFNNTKTPTKPTKEAKWQVPIRPNAKSGMKEYYIEGELKERFCKLFTKNSNRRMMTWFGISFTTLQRFRRELGLEKDMKAIRKQQAKDAKKNLRAQRLLRLAPGQGTLRGLHGRSTKAESRRLPPDEATQSQQSTKIQAIDAKEERAEQGTMAQGTASCLLRTGASNQTPNTCCSDVTQGYGTKARHDKMLQLLCRPRWRPSHRLL